MSLKKRIPHKCKRCGYEWLGILNPTTCASKKCRSLYWNRDYKFAVTRKKHPIKRSKNTCKRCGYEWIGKKDTVGCPNPRCCSPYWNKDYVTKRKSKKKKYRYSN